MKKHDVLFYLKKSKTNQKSGEAPIYLRITVDGKRAEISTGRKIKPISWDSKANRPKGTKEEAQTLNVFLTDWENKVNQAVNKLSLDGKEISADNIKNSFIGVTVKKHTLIETIEYHNHKIKEKIGTDYAESTYEKYDITLKKVKAYIRYHFRKGDLLLEELNHLFIEEFEHYLKIHDGNKHNTSSKYLKNLKKIIKDAQAWEWINRDPFINFHCTYDKPNRPHLVWEEIRAIENKKFALPRLTLVQDAFIFSIYTGLAFADLAKLTKDNIVTGNDGRKWIIINRKKTGTRAPIRLLPKALEIIEKYKDDPICEVENKVIPLYSHQKTNSYLKEIADVCGIKKTISFHIARHTYATTVTLANGVPIETVSKTLGHSSIRATQEYAKVVDDKISNDFDALELKLKPVPQPVKLEDLKIFCLN